VQGWRVIGLVLAVLAVLVPADFAMACSCAPQSPAESLEEADAAIVGRLVAVMPHGPAQAVYRYEVHRVYKGAEKIETETMLSVHSARRGSACALPRRLGRSYGLFLLGRHGRWFGGICRVVSPKRMRQAGQGQAAGSARAPVQPVLCG
jgi:hypothetical protein